ncbi:hypothetical protein [Nodularia sp. NIES-3585]|nr:hypothetical protein [Nodularia sp. NIES-3585]
MSRKPNLSIGTLGTQGAYPEVLGTSKNESWGEMQKQPQPITHHLYNL